MNWLARLWRGAEKPSAARREALGLKPTNRRLDLGVPAPTLLPAPEPQASGFDSWMIALGIETHARHNAAADALAAAQLFQVILAGAERRGIKNTADLPRLEQDQRSLSRSRSHP